MCGNPFKKSTYKKIGRAFVPSFNQPDLPKTPPPPKRGRDTSIPQAGIIANQRARARETNAGRKTPLPPTKAPGLFGKATRQKPLEIMQDRAKVLRAGRIQSVGQLRGRGVG